MILLFVGYFAVLAYRPDWMSLQVVKGSVINVGLYASVLFILFIIGVTGFYNWWVGGPLEALKNQILQQAGADDEE